jgi:hypothetical protein
VVWLHQAILENSNGDRRWAAGSLVCALVTPVAAFLTLRAAQHARRPLLAVIGAGFATAAIASVVIYLWFGVAMAHGLG